MNLAAAAKEEAASRHDRSTIAPPATGGVSGFHGADTAHATAPGRAAGPEYDRTMVSQRRAAVLIAPTRIYGS